MSAVLTFLAVVDLCLCPVVASLDASRFRTREAVTAALVRCGPVARPALLRGLHSSRAEVCARSRHALDLIDFARESYCWDRSAALLPRGWDRLPWIHVGSGGYYDPLTARYMAAVHAGGTPYGGKVDAWPDWREGARAWVATMLRDHASEADIVADLDRMAWQEAGWTWRECRVWCVLPVR